LKRAEEMESAVAFRGGIFECANKSRVAAGKAERRKSDENARGPGNAQRLIWSCFPPF